MITRYLGDCNKSYDFKPLVQWPSTLPFFCWDDELLCGFDTKIKNELQIVINLKSSETQMADVLAFIYPQLTLPELARLYTKLKVIKEIKDWGHFFSLYKIRFCENLISTLDILVQTPISFQLWVSQKQIQARELSPLKCISNFVDIEPFLNKFLELNLTRSQGIQVLELLIELIEMKISKEVLHSLMNGSPNSIHVKLMEMRYPLATEKQNNVQNKLDNIFKVTGVEALSRRYGDKSGVEVKFFSETNWDFQQRLNSLNKWYETNKDQDWI